MSKELAYDAAAFLADEAAVYLATGRASLRVVWTDQVPLAAVDEGWRMYLNPVSFPKLKPKEAGYVILEELGHVLKKHAERCRTRYAIPEIWNIAADLELFSEDWGGLENPLTFEDGRNGNICQSVTHDKYSFPKGKLVEDYYSMLCANKKIIKITLVPRSGSGADGEKRPWERPLEDLNMPGLTNAEAEAVRVQVAAKIQEYKKHQDGYGNLPGGWDLWADSILKPVVPWQRVLHCALTSGLQRIGLGSQSYIRARERFGVCLPRHVRRSPVIALVLDTSGSMGQGTNSPLQQALSEVIGIAKIVGVLNVAWCDAAANIQHNVRKFSDLRPTGGGGTNMGIGIAAFDTITGQYKPDLIVTVTDGDTPWPAAPPKVPHVAVIIGNSHPGPKWGTVIHAPLPTQNTTITNEP